MKPNPSIIVIGASLGGLDACRRVLGTLPVAFPFPVAIVLHRGASSDSLLCTSLQSECALPVSGAFDKEPVAAGRVCVAPAGYHLLVDGSLYNLSTGAPVNHSRPSIDVLFDSAADAFGGNVCAVVLTGNGDDGVRGAERIRRRKGFVVVQDPVTAEARSLPAAAAPYGNRILPLEDIGPFLAGLAVSREKTA